MDKKINKNDVIIGLTASGNTKFTVELIKKSIKKQALTIGISNNKDSILEKFADHHITLDTG